MAANTAHGCDYWNLFALPPMESQTGGALKARSNKLLRETLSERGLSHSRFGQIGILAQRLRQHFQTLLPLSQLEIGHGQVVFTDHRVGLGAIAVLGGRPLQLSLRFPIEPFAVQNPA